MSPLAGRGLFAKNADCVIEHRAQGTEHRGQSTDKSGKSVQSKFRSAHFGRKRSAVSASADGRIFYDAAAPA